MALRNIIVINEEKCNGCGLCAKACAEGAIKIINGKAKLVSETYCDGLGACIGHCPQDAIRIIQREAKPFDEKPTKEHLKQMKQPQPAPFMCPGMASAKLRDTAEKSDSAAGDVASQLTHWPVQLKLVSPHAPYFADARLLLVADCVPFAMGDFHSKFLRGHSIVVGCPKLDDALFYVEKLADILKTNKLKSLSVVHMEVPCCSGLTRIAQQALAKAGVKMTFEDVTIGLNGSISKVEQISVN
ncbi:MAG: 4Fe-4S binding protein [Sedimentisphaerales bacterium]|jgi:NAD-dependent dihydropyrimidine dehydrogenase PreA subunit